MLIYYYCLCRAGLLVKKEMICRLCLQSIGNNNCRPVVEVLLKSLKLNTNISKENVMCIECANRLQIFSNFTPGCVYMGVGKDCVKLEQEPIETTSNPKSLINTEVKCNICARTHGREDLISSDNLKNTEELLTCETCLMSLEGLSSVILKCREVEEKISKYIELQGTDHKGQVELKKVQQFMFRPILKSETESIGLNELEYKYDQVQEKYTAVAEGEIKYEKEISNKELNIKTEDDDINSDQSDCDIPDISSKESNCDGFQKLFIENKNPSEINMFKYELLRQLLSHKNPSKIKMFKCEFCPYETKQETSLRQHILTHKSPSESKMFKCEMCSYAARQKRILKQHLLIHKSPSEIMMFKCELCPYEAKRRYDLKSHILAHKSPSETKMFKCELCTYKTKREVNLRQHILSHKSPSKIKKFKCVLCSVQKCHMKSHLPYQ